MPSPLKGRTLLVYLFLCAIWGSTWLVVKIGLQYLPPLRFAGWRISLACLMLVPFALFALAMAGVVVWRVRSATRS